jgi:hypothetical protein
VLSLADKLTFVQQVFGTYRISRDSRNVDVRCPICDPKDRTKLKLSILTDTDDDRCLAVHCWTCGYKSRSLWSLIIRYGTQEQLLEFRDRFLPEAMRHRVHDEVIDARPEKLTLPDDFRLLATSQTRDPDVMAIRKYLLLRRVTERDQWYFKLGYSDHPAWKRRVIMPSFDGQGELNIYVGRAIDKFRRPKYEMPSGDRHHVVFNELNVDWSRRLVLCEGAFDMMKCGDNAVAMLGSDMNERSALFSAIIAHRTPVALAMDADMRVTKMPRLASRFAAYDIDVVIVKVPTDPGDMSKQEFRAALAAATPFDWTQTFLDRLEAAAKVSL